MSVGEGQNATTTLVVPVEYEYKLLRLLPATRESRKKEGESQA